MLRPQPIDIPFLRLRPTLAISGRLCRSAALHGWAGSFVLDFVATADETNWATGKSATLEEAFVSSLYPEEQPAARGEE